MNGASCKLLVDSGAAVTVMSIKLYEQMPTETRPKLIPLSDHVQLQSADKGILNVHGIIGATVNVGSKDFEWNAYIADISDEGLLGFDFMHHFNCILEARRGLHIDNILIPIELQDCNSIISAVYVKYDVVVPPRSEFIVPGKIDNCDIDSHACAIIEQTAHEWNIKNLHVAGCLIDVTRNDIDIPVRVVNTSSEEINLHAGMRIGSMELISDVCDMCNNDVIKSSNPSIRTVKADSSKEVSQKSWPDDLQTLYQKSCEGLDPHTQDQLFALLDKHSSTIASSSTDIGRTSIVQHSIDTGDAAPIKQRPRRPPRAFIDEEEKIIETQLQMGIIRESTSAWSSPLVYVKKRDGTTRPCVDYRKLNDVTRKDAYPLPRIEDCLDCLGGAQIFSTLDLQSGYWQIDIKEEDRHKTAFSTRTGHYEYVTMPFGLCNAPGTFERAMELIMKGLQWRTLILYLDDIIVMSSTIGEHINRLDEVLGRLGQAGLKLKPSKCHLFQTEVSYLGHVVSAAGIRPDPGKVEQVRNWPTPTSISDVRSFLGLCSYYRRFIRGFSTIAAPLNRLLEKSSKFEWNDDCKSALEQLKNVLVSDNVMAYPDDHGMFILDADASSSGIGAVLSQIQWDDVTQREVERPVAFASRTLTKTQRRYCTTRRELLAIVSFVRHFRHYLLGRKFLVRTDHSSLRWIMSFREPTDQLARWIEILSQFDFDIEHRAGRNHGNADAMSRIPCDPESCDCYDKETIIEQLPCGGCTTCVKRHKAWSQFFDEDDDVVPVTHMRVQQTRLKSVSDYSEQTPPLKPEDSSHSSRLSNIVTMILVIVVFVVKMFCRLPRIVLDFILYIVVLELRGLRYVRDGFDVMKRGNWPSPFRVSVVRNASTSRLKSRTKHSSVNVRASDNLPCASDTGAIAGGNSGQREVLRDNFDRETLSTMQRDDPDVGIIYKWISESPERPNRALVHDKSPIVRNLWLLWTQLELIDGVLYKRHVTNHKLTTTRQLVVPFILRDQILESNHKSVLSGHLGVKKTFSKMQQRLYWLNMRESVKLYIGNCVKCGARKRPTSKPKGPLGKYNCGFPMDRVALDIMGPFPISNQGNRYVLVVGDVFTKWIEAYGIPDQTARTVANIVVNEFIARWGIPLEIHSDQGKTFESQLFQHVCQLLEITKTRTTPYHPSSNGMIERFNQTLVNMMSAYVDKKQENWDLNLSLLTSAYRSTIHETTGFSPNFLMLGREVRTPIEIALGVDKPDINDRDYHEYAANIVSTMKEAYNLTREHLASQTQRQKRDYDARLSVNTYRPGDLVYYLDTTRKKGLSPKLKSAFWVGPCVVTRKMSDLVFEIKAQQQGKVKVLHHDRLKPFKSNDIPQWVKEQSKKVRNNVSFSNTCTTGTQTSQKDTFSPRRSSRRSIAPDRFVY